MEMASFNGFIKTLVYIVLFWYLFKFLGRIFAPIIVKKAMSKMQDQFNQHQNHQNNQNDQNQKHSTKNEFPREKKKVGEYVDYEELD